MAMGLVDYFLEHNVSVPDRISVIGFDDSQIATEGRIKLSTVRVPADILGYKAAEMLVKRLNNNDELYKRLVIEPQLIIRESTKEISLSI